MKDFERAREALTKHIYRLRNKSAKAFIQWLKKKKVSPMQKWYQHLRRRWVKGTMRFTGLFDGPKKIVTKKTAQNSPKSTIWRKNWHITLFFQIILITKKVRSRWVQGTMKFLGWFNGPKKIVTKKTTQNSPKLTIWRKNWHITLFFQITLTTKKVRSSRVLGTMKFLG